MKYSSKETGRDMLEKILYRSNIYTRSTQNL